MKQKITSISAWLALGLWVMGLLLKVFGLPGAAAGLVFGTLISQFFFIPLFFFTKNEPLDVHYTSKWIRKVQGISFFIVGFSPVFSLQHWPGATIIFYLGIISILTLIISLFYTRQPHFRQPHYLALLIVLILNFGVLRIANQIGKNQQSSSLSPLYYQTLEKRTALQNEYESLINKNTESTNPEADSVVSVLNEIQKELYLVADQLPKDIHDSFWVNSLPYNSSNFEVASQIMIGPDLSNPYGENQKYSALRLKKKWQTFAEPRIKEYPDSLSRMSSFSFDGYAWYGNFKESWEISEFYHLPIGLVFTRFELYRLFVYTELSIDAYKANGQNIPALFKLKRKQVFNAFTKDLELAQQGYQSKEENQNAFMFMMAFACMLTVLTFFIPKWNITEKWKMRILLFNLVIIFEFILLLTDLYLGTFSQNPLYLLGANILLALGLVTLDNFLRNNFLKWYETKDEA